MPEMLLLFVGWCSRAANTAAPPAGGGLLAPAPPPRALLAPPPRPMHYQHTPASTYPRAVPDSSDLTLKQRRAAAALLREPAAAIDDLAHLFAASGHELSLVGGIVRDVFLGRDRGDREFDLATDARPDQVRRITERWADKIWETGIEFGTLGLRKGNVICEITTYRSEEYQPDSR